MDPRQKRIQDLNELLNEDYGLLRKLEKAYRLEDDPRRKEKYKSDIEDLNAQINEHQEELQSLTNKLQYTQSVHEEVDKSFKNDKMPGSPADLPAAANQSHSGIDTSKEGTATTSGEARSPKVFISYSHDSQKHADRVLELSDHLRADGIDCMLDQYLDSPPEGFPRWMDRQIHDADFVLMICTPTYFRRVMGTEKPGTGQGVAWESTLIYQYIYNAGTSNSRFIPVLLERANASDIPTPWQGVMYYRPDTNEGYESLYRRLTGQPFILKPELGPRRRMPSRERKQDFDLNVAIKTHHENDTGETKARPAPQPQQVNVPEDDIPMSQRVRMYKQTLEQIRKELNPGNLSKVSNKVVEVIKIDIRDIFDYFDSIEGIEEIGNVLNYVTSKDLLNSKLSEIMLELQGALNSWDFSKETDKVTQRSEALSDYMNHLSRSYVLLKDALDCFIPNP